MGKNFYFTDNGEFVYAQYKTKRTKQDIIIALKKQLFIYLLNMYFQHIR